MNKQELKFYIAADLMMNRGKFSYSMEEKIHNLFRRDLIIDYLKAMRYKQYYDKKWGGVYWRYRFRKLGLKLGFTINPTELGYGVIIPHYGTIVVGSGNRIGNYAVFHTCICITAGNKIIGDGLYCATGCKILNDIQIGDYVTIGANAVLNKSVSEGSALMLGIPAQKKREEWPWFIRDGEIYQERQRRCEELRKKLFE